MVKGRHFDRSVILLCERWYLAYNLSLRNLKEMDAMHRLEDRSRRKMKPIRFRQSRYLDKRIEQDQRAIKRRIRLMLGFKPVGSARAILGRHRDDSQDAQKTGAVCLH
jgi:transposase-like protein